MAELHIVLADDHTVVRNALRLLLDAESDFEVVAEAGDADAAVRYARGHKALYTFEINGEQASIFWDLHDLHRLQYFDHRDEGRVRGWRSIHVSDGDHPYMKNWWVPGLQIGYEHTFIHEVADFLVALDGNRTAAPTFRDGLATDYVTDAVLKSAKTKKWEAVPVA